MPVLKKLFRGLLKRGRFLIAVEAFECGALAAEERDCSKVCNGVDEELP